MKQNLLFEKKTKKSYSNISLSAIKRILYGRDPTNPNVIFYGSSVYKSTNKYANDIDCLEMVQETNPIIIVKRLKEMIKDYGITSLYVRIRGQTGGTGPGPGAHALVKTLQKEGYKVISISDITKVARGGPKKKGGRRGRRV